MEPAPRFLRAWGRRGKGEGEFDGCISIAVGPGDTIYVTEFHNRRIQQFTPEGRFVAMFPVPANPAGLAVDRLGNLYLALWSSQKVAVYSSDGKLLREWGGMGTEDGQLRNPNGVGVGPDGLIYVADAGNSRVQKFTAEGKFVGKWGERGKEPGQFGANRAAGSRFAGPQFLAFDRDGNVYVTDAATYRVQKFSPAGRILAHWGHERAEPGGFGPPVLNQSGNPNISGPIGICVDRSDRVWVGATNHRVQQFSAAGKYLLGFGGEGSETGRFHLPHGLALDSRGHLYVVDTLNSRVQCFDVG